MNETKYATIDRDTLKQLQADSEELARLKSGKPGIYKPVLYELEVEGFTHEYLRASRNYAEETAANWRKRSGRDVTITPLYTEAELEAKNARIAELEGLLQRILKISDWEINYREDAEECDQEHEAVHAEIRAILGEHTK